MVENNIEKKKKGQGIKWVPDREELATISAHASHGTTMKQIAAIIGVNEQTLCQNDDASHAAEIGRSKAIDHAARTMYELAFIDKDPRYMPWGIFWMKSVAHWKENHDQQPVVNVLNITSENYGKIKEIAKAARAGEIEESYD